MFPCNLGGRNLTTGYSEEIRRTSGSEGHLCLLAVRSVVEIDFTAVDGSQEQVTYDVILTIYPYAIELARAASHISSVMS
jgi:hypothetical protein